MHQVVFIQGGGEGAYETDAQLAASLRNVLGAAYAVHYPRMPKESDPDYKRWKEQIRKELAAGLISNVLGFVAIRAIRV